MLLRKSRKKKSISDRFKQERRSISSLNELAATGQIELKVLVRRYRTEVLDMTQAELAEECSVSRKTISDIENGNEKTTIGLLNQVLNRMGFEMTARAITHNVYIKENYEKKAKP